VSAKLAPLESDPLAAMAADAMTAEAVIAGSSAQKDPTVTGIAGIGTIKLV